MSTGSLIQCLKWISLWKLTSTSSVRIINYISCVQFSYNCTSTLNKGLNLLCSTMEGISVFAAYLSSCFWSEFHLLQLAYWHSALSDLWQRRLLSFLVWIQSSRGSLKETKWNSTTWLLSGWASKVLCSLALRFGVVVFWALHLARAQKRRLSTKSIGKLIKTCSGWAKCKSCLSKGQVGTQVFIEAFRPLCYAMILTSSYSWSALFYWILLVLLLLSIRW